MHLLKFIEHIEAFHFKGICARKVFLWPDSETAYLLMGSELFVRLLNYCFCIARVIHEQHGVDFWPLVSVHQTKYCRVFEQLIRLQDVFYILWINIQSIGEHDYIFLATF